jgi:predicted ArsR family transcriptional regulator
MAKSKVNPPEPSKTMTVDEVAEVLQISKSTAYHTMQRLNKELKDKGFIVHAGRVPRAYLMERCGL